MGGVYVFTPVCRSVHKGGGVVVSLSVHAGILPPLGAHTNPGTVHAGRYGQQMGGMHPTGMHTC